MKLTPEQRAFVFEEIDHVELPPEVASHDVLESGHAINAADIYAQKLTTLESRIGRIMGAGYDERFRMSGSWQASGSTGQPHSRRGSQ
jgi:hypothetical protein